MTATATAPEVKVIETKMYVAVDPANNNNKWWKYERLSTPVSEMSKGKMLTGDIRFTWGRVGADKPESKVEMFNEKTLASKIREKTNKKDGPSYTLITTVGGSQGSVAPKQMAKEEVKRVAVAEIGGKCPITSALVKKLAKANRHELLVASGGELDIDLETGIVRTALGVVTIEAVKAARKYLDQMAPYVRSGRTEDLSYQQLLGNYLRNVPQKVGFKRGWHTNFIQLDKQTQLLDQLESSIEIANQRQTDAINNVNKVNAKPLAQTFNCELKLVDDRNVISKIERMYYDSKGRHECSHLRPVRVYEVRIPHMEAAFNADGKKVGNIKSLWHGTRMFNVLSILKRGFVLPTELSTVQTTGAMYGTGLYFSAMSTKSLNYAYGYWDGGSRDKNCYMFMVDVAMGKEYIPSGSGNGKRLGYDSCWAKPGRSGVINDEQIVYRTSQANIRYLVEFN
jgi:poly [ADP-ribose] polymerase